VLGLEPSNSESMLAVAGDASAMAECNWLSAGATVSYMRQFKVKGTCCGLAEL